MVVLATYGSLHTAEMLLVDVKLGIEELLVLGSCIFHGLLPLQLLFLFASLVLRQLLGIVLLKGLQKLIKI